MCCGTADNKTYMTAMCCGTAQTDRVPSQMGALAQYKFTKSVRLHEFIE